MRNLFTALPLVVAMTTISQGSLAQDDDRLDRMQQTIQELTLQLGDALRENGALRKQLRAAQAGEPIADCPPVTPHPHQPSKILPRDGSAPRDMMTQPSPRSGMQSSVPMASTQRARTSSCDVQELVISMKSRKDASAKEMLINSWLGDNAGSCSRDELLELREFSRTLSLGDDAQSLIDYYLDQ